MVPIMVYDFRMKLPTSVIAQMLDVTDRRVRDIAKELGIKPQRLGQTLLFTRAQVQRMKARKTKAGPPKKKGKKR